jgi:diacylglycerol kinase (ATP)
MSRYNDGESMTEPRYRSTFKSKGGMRRIAQAGLYSWKGLRAAFVHEAAFRQELLLVVCLAPFAFWLGRSVVEVVVLLGALLLILIVELLNSAIEALADAISVDTHPLLGRAKDLGSAAVFVSFVCAAVAWGGIAIARFWN